jgi:hypothetical protein
VDLSLEASRKRGNLQKMKNEKEKRSKWLGAAILYLTGYFTFP